MWQLWIACVKGLYWLSYRCRLQAHIPFQCHDSVCKFMKLYEGTAVVEYAPKTKQSIRHE